MTCNSGAYTNRLRLTNQRNVQQLCAPGSEDERATEVYNDAHWWCVHRQTTADQSARRATAVRASVRGRTRNRSVGRRAMVVRTQTDYG